MQTSNWTFSLILGTGLATSLSALLLPKNLSWVFSHITLFGLFLAALYFTFDTNQAKKPSMDLIPKDKSCKALVVPLVKNPQTTVHTEPEISQDAAHLSVKPLKDEHVKQLESLKTQFLEMADTQKYPVGSNPDEPFQLVLSKTSSDPSSHFQIQVQQKKGTDFTFRLLVEMDTSPEEAFDYLSDISKRPSWDDICEEAGVVEDLDSVCCIQVRKKRLISVTNSYSMI
jgi:hypothetical protein